MTLIEWRDEYSLGIPSVDHEHRELIDLINATHARLQADAQHGEVEDFLGEMFARISAHFALEERTMLALGYGEYWEHKDDHERLLDGLRDIMDDFEASDAFDADVLATRLDDWFTIHFRTFDARLHRHVH